MKMILALSILFSLIALPETFGALTDADLNEIRLIVKEEVKIEIQNQNKRIEIEIQNQNKRIDDKFNSLEKRFDSINGKIDDKFNSLEKRFDSIEKNFDRQNAIIIACIAVPMALIALMISWRSVRDNSQEKRIEALAQEIEILKQRQIV